MYDPERVVLEAVLASPSGRSRQAIHRECSDISRDAIEAAISSLEGVGLVRATGKTVYASQGLQRLEQLSLIAV